MKNIDVLSTEHAIVSNLMNYPKLLSKLKLKPVMFTDVTAQNLSSMYLNKAK